MRKSRKGPTPLGLSGVPESIRESLENPEFEGLGNSSDPRDSIWGGYDCFFDTQHALRLDRDPEDALRQVVQAIVMSRRADPPIKGADERIDIGVAAILGAKRKTGPKRGGGKVDRRNISRRAAYLVYERHCDSSKGKGDWKTCLWDALSDSERRLLGKEQFSEKFFNFYNEFMDWLGEGERENNLLFEVSVHDNGTGECNLEQWGWRQRVIDRALADLRTLGVILPEPPGQSTG
jgi:hypothetical protein